MAGVTITSIRHVNFAHPDQCPGDLQHFWCRLRSSNITFFQWREYKVTQLSGRSLPATHLLTQDVRIVRRSLPQAAGGSEGQEWRGSSAAYHKQKMVRGSEDK